MATRQADLICTECPLADCDIESLFCTFRWATNPNDEQLKVTLRAKKREYLEMMLRAKKRRKVKRAEYDARYYAANRERKLAAANERHRMLKQVASVD